MKTIPLTQGKEAVVDDEDYEWLSQWKWCYSKGYAVRGRPRPGRGLIRTHREIMLRMGHNPPEVDHKDGDKCNNRRENLRPATRTDNQRNRQKNNKNNTSGFPGVSWHKRREKWQAQIQVDEKNIYLGYFTDKLEAAKAYEEASVKYFGECARAGSRAA